MCVYTAEARQIQYGFGDDLTERGDDYNIDRPERLQLSNKRFFPNTFGLVDGQPRRDGLALYRGFGDALPTARGTIRLGDNSDYLMPAVKRGEDRRGEAARAHKNDAHLLALVRGVGLSHPFQSVGVRMVYKQQSVQVIKLVLKDSGLQAVGCYANSVSFKVQSLHRYRGGAAHLALQTGDAQTALNLDFLAFSADDLRVEQRLGTLWCFVDDYLFGHAYLVSREAEAPGVLHYPNHAIYQRSQLRVRRIHWPRAPSQNVFAVQEDVFNFH